MAAAIRFASWELHGARPPTPVLVLCVCLLSVVAAAGDSRARTGALSDGDQFQVQCVYECHATARVQFSLTLDVIVSSGIQFVSAQWRRHPVTVWFTHFFLTPCVCWLDPGDFQRDTRRGTDARQGPN